MFTAGATEEKGSLGSRRRAPFEERTQLSYHNSLQEYHK